MAAKIEVAVNKKMHDKVVPFKLEMGVLIETLGKANSEEISGLSRSLQEAVATQRQQDRVVTSLCDKYEAVTSQLQVIESGGRQTTDEQRQMLQKARDNVRAEAMVVLNERLKEELDTLEERLGKKIEEVDKRVKGVEKTVDSQKSEQSEQKAKYEALATKLEDIGKLVAELTVSSNKTSSEDIGSLG